MKAGTGSAVDWWGADQVLSGYDFHAQNRENMYFSLWQGNVPKFVYEGGDIGEGRELLETSITPLQVNGSTAMYTIRFHPQPKDGNINSNSPVNGSANFKMCEPSFTAGIAGTRPAAPQQQSEHLKIIVDLLQKQDDRLTALEQAQDIEEIEEVDEVEDEVGRIISGINRIEETVQKSPMLGDLYTDLRLGLRLLGKKLGIEIPQQTHHQANTVTGNTMDNNTQTEARVDMKQIMSELVKGFPELPHLLVTLHNIMVTDPDTFDLAKKKLIDGVNKLS